MGARYDVIAKRLHLDRRAGITLPRPPLAKKRRCTHHDVWQATDSMRSFATAMVAASGSSTPFFTAVI